MFDQINLELKPSLILSTFISMVGVISMSLILTRDIPFGILLLIILVIFMINIYLVNLYGLLRLSRSVTHIKLLKNTLTLFFNNKPSQIAKLSDNSLITPWACILIFTSNKKKRVVFIYKYNTNCLDNYRRFRVWTKFGKTTPQTSALLE